MFIIIAFLSCIVGILISLYIYIRKIQHKKLACPREHPCDIVLHSQFNKTFGIPNEILGIFYFFIVAILLYIAAFNTVSFYIPVLYFLFFTLVLGALFSVYLTMLQAFFIRAWCAWCTLLVLVNIILIISLANLPFDLIHPILAVQKFVWVMIHNVGFILGLGAATITDVLFFRFLKDNSISQEEKETMDTLTNIIWTGLAILIISGIALFLPEQSKLAVSSKFLLKLVVVGVIVLNGLVLNMFIAPHMRRLSFGGSVPERRFRRVAFALGGISITSWYLAFILGSLRKIDISFPIAVLGYLLLLICVVVGSQFAERYITKKRSNIEQG